MNHLLTFRMKTGLAAVAIDEVLSIVPDLESNERSLVITGAFPEGLTAEKPSVVLIGDWIELLEENYDEIADDLARELAAIDAELEEELEEEEEELEP